MFVRRYAQRAKEENRVRIDYILKSLEKGPDNAFSGCPVDGQHSKLENILFGKLNPVLDDMELNI